MNRLALITFLWAITSGTAAAQAPSQTCPVITLTGPTERIGKTETATVTVKVTGASPRARFTFLWSAVKGEILNGQGSSTATIEPTTDEYMTVLVEVTGNGIPKGCNRVAGIAIEAGNGYGGRRFAQYLDMPDQPEELDLKNFADEVRRWPGARAYVVVYGKRGHDPTEITQRIDSILEYFVNHQRDLFEPSRFVTKDGGFRDEFTVELWIVPQGEEPPTESADQ